MIAISYIKNKENIDIIRNFLREIHAQHLKIIAKIETPEAIQNIEDIVKYADGIVIDRKKLTLLVGEQKTERTKKEIIHYCHVYGKPIIMTTGLDMRSKNNAKTLQTLVEEIHAGVDTFMLTKETAV